MKGNQRLSWEWQLQITWGIHSGMDDSQLASTNTSMTLRCPPFSPSASSTGASAAAGLSPVMLA